MCKRLNKSKGGEFAISREQKYLIVACIVFLVGVIYIVTLHVHLWRQKNALSRITKTVELHQATSEEENHSPVVSGNDSDTRRVIAPSTKVGDTQQSPGSSTTSPVSDEADSITVDLVQAQMELKAWGAALLKQFPDAPVAPVAKAVSDSFQEMIRLVIIENERLRQKGIPTKARQKQLAQFVEERLVDIVRQTRSDKLAMDLLREHTELKLKLDDYMHENIPPLPAYLFGLEGDRYHSHHH